MGEQGLLLYMEGTVCDDGFDDNAANAICKEMGYESSQGWVSGLLYDDMQNSLDTNLDDVHCREEVWSSCSYLTSEEDCGHNEDVFITCIGKISLFPNFPYRTLFFFLYFLI